MTDRPRPDHSRATVIAAAAVLALLVAVHCAVVWHALPRALDHDEGEHLRAAAWLADGRTLYRDFVENHTPFLYLLLAPAAPATMDAAAMREYVTTARILAALAGTAAVLLTTAFAVRLTGSLSAAVPVLAALLASGWTWLRAIADVRAEPFTLFLFWIGALLVLLMDQERRRTVIAGGAGIGLIAFAGLCNPKWPFEMAVFLVVYAMRWWRAARAARRDAILSLLLAAAFPLAGFLMALTVTSPRDFFFFSYVYGAVIGKSFATFPLADTVFKYSDPFAFCPVWFRPAAVIVAVIILGVLWFVRRQTLTIADRSSALLALLLLAASALELRFLYPYPRLWPQYFVMWACSASIVYGLTFTWLLGVLRAPVLRVVAVMIVAALWLTHQWPYLTRPVDERHWATKEELLRRLGEGEAAWVRPEELPSAVPAGSYYWYAFDEQVPLSLQYARTNAEARAFLPAVQDEDLPPCRVLAAHESGAAADYVHVRLIDHRAVRNLPRSRHCLEQLFRRGLLRRVPDTNIWEVAPPPRRAS